MSKIEYLDSYTPQARLIFGQLSPQERLVFCRMITNSASTFKNIHFCSRIQQKGHLSVILSRLIKKKFLLKISKGVYEILKPTLRDWYLMRKFRPQTKPELIKLLTGE